MSATLRPAPPPGRSTTETSYKGTSRSRSWARRSRRRYSAGDPHAAICIRFDRTRATFDPSCVHTALRHEAKIQALRDCHASLTPREREVMALVVSGLLNKQVGARHQRDHGEGTPRQGDAKDEGRLSRRPGENGRETPPRTCAERLTLHRPGGCGSCCPKEVLESRLPPSISWKRKRFPANTSPLRWTPLISRGSFNV